MLERQLIKLGYAGPPSLVLRPERLSEVTGSTSEMCQNPTL